MDKLGDTIFVLIVPVSLAVGLICIIAPVRFVQFLFLWPRTLKNLFGIKFPAGGDDALSLIYADPSSYAIKYGGQLEMVRLMGFIAAVIGMAGLCKLLNIL